MLSIIFIEKAQLLPVIVPVCVFDVVAFFALLFFLFFIFYFFLTLNQAFDGIGVGDIVGGGCGEIEIGVALNSLL